MLFKQKEYFAPLERSRSFGLRFHKHFVPTGLKTEPQFVNRTLEHDTSALRSRSHLRTKLLHTSLLIAP